MTTKNNKTAESSSAKLSTDSVYDRRLEDDVPSEPTAKDAVRMGFATWLPDCERHWFPKRVRALAEQYDAFVQGFGERGYPLVNYWGNEFLTRLKREGREGLLKAYVKEFSDPPYRWDLIKL